MQVFRHIDDPGLALKKSVVTLGNFDGIHLGHRALIEGAVRDARELGVPAAVLTFEPHPVKVLAPEHAPKMILTHKDKMQLLQNLDVDIVVVQHFDLSFAKIAAEDFVRRFLAERLKPAKIWVGRDFRFGQGRKGRAEDLLRWGGQYGFSVAVVEPILVGGVRVSSSQARELIEAGKVDAVTELLGRYHFVSGRVVTGHRRGRDLGFPTANIAARTELTPLDGIYATIFHLGEKDLPSVSSIGVNPTFGAGPKTVESFILNFNGDIYGAPVRLSFVQRLRGEQTFSSVESLVEQIGRDVDCAKEVFRDLRLFPEI
jgi:riboflavin kinase/FMN adenylyltransferase